ncbi:hypothetical protein O6H91_12G078800 [Diphasiastrum complanatum]|uniref:Uncharacterized protein n=1 Tax=Diphasiastrum complanatum TaxID=34168 RepID=A0ACC2C3T5_DIPCM|nr:hypothetical protein O6H91_12G078800 [Diphasiastrum complanatum]
MFQQHAPYYSLNKPVGDLSHWSESAGRSLNMRRSAHKSAHSTTMRLACAAAGLVMAMGGLLYVSVLLSPTLMRSMIQEVVCDPMGSATTPLSHASAAPLLHTLINDTHFSLSNDRAEISVHGNRVAISCSPCESALASEKQKIEGRLISFSDRKFKILLGVLTRPAMLERRNLLRMAYGLQSSTTAEFAVRFVLCEPKNEDDKAMVAMEILHYKDIILVDCEENLNAGKTYVYFYTIASLEERFDYVMKTDDDSYVRLENLAMSLKDLPRSDLYYGYILPCENTDPYSWYMAGMGYVLSWDLVEWIKKSAIAKEKSVGTEDKLVGDWLNAGGKAKTRVNKKPLFYDHPEFGGNCAHSLIPETILIHQVKTPQRWLDVLSFFEKGRFNVTPPIAIPASPPHIAN